MKIKIGENEYQPPFRELDDEEMDEVWVMDAGNNYVKVESVIAALNELAQLRAERDALKARVEEFGAVFDAWWEHYSTQSSDKKQDGWGWIDEAWANLKQSVQTATTPGGDE